MSRARGYEPRGLQPLVGGYSRLHAPERPVGLLVWGQEAGLHNYWGRVAVRPSQAVVGATFAEFYLCMNWQYKEYEAEQAMKAAQRELTETLSLVKRPHMFGSALFHLNAALRRLAEAQWRLMQAKSEYEHGLDKN